MVLKGAVLVFAGGVSAGCEADHDDPPEPGNPSRSDASTSSEKYRIPTPPEVVLHHEIFGHVSPGLRDPKLVVMIAENPILKASDECKALEIENGYRKQIGLPEVPRKLIKCPAP
jgi:hypothetical protein